MVLHQAAAGTFFLLMILSLGISCAAGTTEEVASLLHFIEQSECTFIRNGKPYDALKSSQHIKTKYNYYKKQITSAEEFIQYAAAKSSITGKPYWVLCNGVGMDSSDWLNAELDKMRTTQDIGP